MKSVLISVPPEQCELIASGKETILMTKTGPKINTPFKCYIYEAKVQSDMPTFIDEDGHILYSGRGQVIGKFVCDMIERFEKRICLCGWHISDLKIYNKPKELGEFKKINRECWYADLGLLKRDCYECKNADCYVSRPPRSWRYVEEIKE